MESSERIEELRNLIEKKIKEIFQGREPVSLYQPMYYLLDAGGKRIRPILLILSCQAVGGSIQNSLNAALAIELLHTFTLVHDDIMDNDDIRRGRLTVHKKWDQSTAILAGDGLVTLAYQILLKTGHPKINEVLQRFTKGLLVLCEGQALDKEFESREEVSIQDYEDMIWKKTAKLIEVACEIGAILGNATVKEIEALSQFAASLGIAFQMQDDLLDILSEEKVTGKPLGSDLISKKKTYLTIHFLTHASPSVEKRFQKYWKKDLKNRSDIYQIRKIFEEAGTFNAAQQSVYKLISVALKSLDSIKPSKAKEDLKTLAGRIQNRVS